MSKKILLIDDEADIINILQKQVGRAGYEAHVAYNGQHALAVAEQIHPHLILTDIAMPVMDGIAFYKEVKSRRDLHHIPIIIASAYGASEEQMRQLGAKDFLVKPFDKNMLLTKVGAFFDAHKSKKMFIATKMHRLMQTILDENQESMVPLSWQLTNDAQSLVTKAASYKPDVILLDIDMFIVPSAAEIVRQLREQPGLEDCHILLMRSILIDFSAGGLTSKSVIVEQCLSNGASHFIGHLSFDSFTNILKEYC